MSFKSLLTSNWLQFTFSMGGCRPTWQICSSKLQGILFSIFSRFSRMGQVRCGVVQLPGQDPGTACTGLGQEMANIQIRIRVQKQAMRISKPVQ